MFASASTGETSEGYSVPASESTAEPSGGISATVSVTPEQIRPFPKAGPRKGKGGRRPGKSRILTSTPVKASIEAEHAMRMKKKMKRNIPAAKNVNKCLEFSNSSEENEDVTSSSSSETEVALESVTDSIEKHSYSVNDYALMKLATKKVIYYYVCKIMKKYNDFEYKVKFLRRLKEGSEFVFSDPEDVSDIAVCDMIKLPKPVECAGTERLTSRLKFVYDFSKFNVR